MRRARDQIEYTQDFKMTVSNMCKGLKDTVLNEAKDGGFQKEPSL